jgi:dGTPase
VELFDEHSAAALREFPQLQGRRLLYEAIRRMLSAQVYDVIDSTRAVLDGAALASAADARAAPPLVMFSDAMRSKSAALKRFLLDNLYRHPQVSAKTDQARRVVRDLFAAYMNDLTQMPADFAARSDAARAVADYIAGMTDRFAAREHERLTGLKLLG